MSAIVACGGGGGGGSKGGGSGSNSNNGGGGQPTINVNVNSSNANANTNSNSNANTNNNSNLNLNTNVNSMMLAGLTLNLDANMLNTLKGIIDLPNSTIKIAGTNDVAKIQTNATSGAMTLTFDNLKNIHAGQNVTLDINDGTHTASAVVNTAKGGGTGTTGTTSGGTGSGSGGTGTNPSGAGANNGNGASGQNGQGRQQQIELKVDGGVDKQTGNPIVTTKPLTCKVDTIETPEHPQHNTGTGSTNGQGNQQNQQDGGLQQGGSLQQNGQTAGNNLGTNGGPTIVGTDGLTYDECVAPDDPNQGSGTGIGGFTNCDMRPLVTSIAFSVNASNMTGLDLTKTTYKFLGVNSSARAKLNNSANAIDFTFSNIVGIHEGDNLTVSFNDGTLNSTATLTAKNSKYNQTDILFDTIYGGYKNSIPASAASCDANSSIQIHNTYGGADRDAAQWGSSVYKPITSLSSKVGISSPHSAMLNPINVLYCTIHVYGSADTYKPPLSVPVRMTTDMFDANGITNDLIKFMPARGCEKVFDSVLKHHGGQLICNSNGHGAYPEPVISYNIQTFGNIVENSTPIVVRDVW